MPPRQERTPRPGDIQRSVSSWAREGVARRSQRWRGLSPSPAQCWAPPYASGVRVWSRGEGGEGAGGHVLRGAAEGTGFVWFGEKEAEGRPHRSLPLAEEGVCKGVAELLSPGCRDRMPGNGPKLRQGRVRFDVRKLLCTELVGAPGLPGFKRRLDNALSSWR